MSPNEDRSNGVYCKHLFIISVDCDGQRKVEYFIRKTSTAEALSAVCREKRSAGRRIGLSFPTHSLMMTIAISIDIVRQSSRQSSLPPLLLIANIVVTLCLTHCCLQNFGLIHPQCVFYWVFIFKHRHDRRYTVPYDRVLLTSSETIQIAGAKSQWAASELSMKMMSMRIWQRNDTTRHRLALLLSSSLVFHGRTSGQKNDCILN